MNEPMTLNQYQEAAAATAIYPMHSEEGAMYTTLGLVSEVGEFAGKIKKYIRDGGDQQAHVEALKDELGDVLWYVAMVAEELDISLDALARRNLNKLTARKVKGTLQGSGDNR